jgi:hypothetical protein
MPKIYEKKVANKSNPNFTLRFLSKKNINTISIFMNIKISSFPISLLGLLELIPSKEQLQMFEAIIGIEMNFQ